MGCSGDSAAQKTKAEILRLNNFLENRVAEKTKELVVANEDLSLAEDLLNASFDLAARLQDIQKAERQLLARVAYDDLGQALSDLASVIQGLPTDQASGMKTKTILRRVENVMESVRRVAKELRQGSPDRECARPNSDG